MLAYDTRNAVAQDVSGTVGITFGLTAMVVMMSIGCAVDFGRALAMRSLMQKVGDAAALNSVTAEATLAATRLSAAQARLPQQTARYGGQSTGMTARWLTDTDYEVITTAEPS